MNHSKYLFFKIVSIIGLILFSQWGFADEPLPNPSVKRIWSANKKYYAVMDPDKNITKVYQYFSEDKKETLWSMYGWFRVAGLSSDGKHLVTGFQGMNLLPVNHKQDEVMLYFFKEGKLIHYVTLDQLIEDLDNLQRTVSHIYWGNYLGFDEEGHYVLETVENRKIAFDVKTGIRLRD
jgi:hypothetical protein